MRTGLKPIEPTRRSPTKFPPVRSGWRSNSPPLAGSAREPEWSHDMIRGIQLKTAAKRPMVASTSPRRTPNTEESKTTPSVKQQEERKFSNPLENGKAKEIEVSHCCVENRCEMNYKILVELLFIKQGGLTIETSTSPLGKPLSPSPFPSPTPPQVFDILIFQSVKFHNPLQKWCLNAIRVKSPLYGFRLTLL